MAYQYRTGDRTFGGSGVPRLSPRICNTGLNGRIGTPNLPQTLVRETSQYGCIKEDNASMVQRKGNIDSENKGKY